MQVPGPVDDQSGIRHEHIQQQIGEQGQFPRPRATCPIPAWLSPDGSLGEGRVERLQKPAEARLARTSSDCLTHYGQDQLNDHDSIHDDWLSLNRSLL